MKEKRTRPIEELNSLVERGVQAWAELGVVDSENYGPALPSAIRIRKADGTIDERPIKLIVPTDDQVMKAIGRAKQVALDNNLDPDRTPNGQHYKWVEYLEQREELAFAVRDDKLTQMFVNGSELAELLPHRRTVEALYARLDEWKLMCDPRYSDLTGEELWGVIAKIAKSGTISPLAHIDGLAQIECITLSAREALKSPTAPPSLRSPSITGSANEPPPAATESKPPT